MNDSRGYLYRKVNGIFRVLPGTPIKMAVEEARGLAELMDMAITFDFAGYAFVTVAPRSKVEAIVRTFEERGEAKGMISIGPCL